MKLDLRNDSRTLTMLAAAVLAWTVIALLEGAAVSAQAGLDRIPVIIIFAGFFGVRFAMGRGIPRVTRGHFLDMLILGAGFVYGMDYCEHWWQTGLSIAAGWVLGSIAGQLFDHEPSTDG